MNVRNMVVSSKCTSSKSGADSFCKRLFCGNEYVLPIFHIVGV
jgi:hypothetical protein